MDSPLISSPTISRYHLPIIHQNTVSSSVRIVCSFIVYNTRKGKTLPCSRRGMGHGHHGNQRQAQTLVYHSKEVYIKEKWAVFTPENGKIEPDNYNFSFTFKLPWDLPGSFKGAHGKIEYSVKGNVHRSGLCLATKQKLPFTLAPIRDLNKTPEKQEPVTKKGEKKYGMIFWKRKPVVATVRLNKQGFVYSDNVEIAAELDNKSSVNMAHTRVSLWKTVTFSAEEKRHVGVLEAVKTQTKVYGSRSSTMAIAKTRLDGVTKGNKVELPVACLEIPTETPPSGMEHCTLIDVAYTIQFEAVPSGLHRFFKFVMSIPIDIGSVPFKDHVEIKVRVDRIRIGQARRSNTHQISAVRFTSERFKSKQYKSANCWYLVGVSKTQGLFPYGISNPGCDAMGPSDQNTPAMRWSILTGKKAKCPQSQSKSPPPPTNPSNPDSHVEIKVRVDRIRIGQARRSV
eukprot:sb/3464565/